MAPPSVVQATQVFNSQTGPIDMDHEADMLRLEEITKAREEALEAGDSKGDNIKVSVRVRPVNSRERGLKSEVVTSVDHDANTISLTAPGANEGKSSGSSSGASNTPSFKSHRFAFDHVFDSHDADATGELHATQRTVFEQIGLEICESGQHGFNTSLFAYGQTGSGKTHSMSGSKADPGLIPRICDMLFYMIQKQTAADSGVSCEATASYLEIYNERTRDLLRPSGGELKVRDSPTTGPFVQGLSWLECSSAKDIDDLMEEGVANRTTGATAMNAQSSRSHSIFTLYLSQKRQEFEGATVVEHDRHSKLALIDLAGSESAKTTGATGQRLKESNNINRSLTCLGRCISELVKLSNSGGATTSSASSSSSGGRRGSKSVGSGGLGHVPFRDSVLTMLLRDCLGGNSKTNLLIAVSPADVNYNETLSTLRFAQQCKQIKTKAVVNDNQMTRLVGELKAEVERLKQELSRKSTAPGGSPPSAADWGAGGGGAQDETEVVAALPEEQQRKYKELVEQAQKPGATVGPPVLLPNGKGGAAIMVPDPEGSGGFLPLEAVAAGGGEGGGSGSHSRAIVPPPGTLLIPAKTGEMSKGDAAVVVQMYEQMKRKKAADAMRRLRERRRKHHKALGSEGSNEWTPYLTNVTDDPMTTGTLKIFLLEEKPTLILGSRDHGLQVGAQQQLPSPKLARGGSSRREGKTEAYKLGDGSAAEAASLPQYHRDLELDGLGMEAIHVCVSVGADLEAPPVDLDFRDSVSTVGDGGQFGGGGEEDPDEDVKRAAKEFVPPLVTVEACTATAEVYVNGHKLAVPGPKGARRLEDGDRVVLGVCAQLFIFKQPSLNSILADREAKREARLTVRESRERAGSAGAGRALVGRTSSARMSQENNDDTALVDPALRYMTAVKEVILHRDETKMERHIRYARMVQSIIRRKTYARSFEQRLVRALQQVQSTNALAKLFAGDDVWFEIHFAGGLGCGSGGWGQHLFGLGTQDILRPEAVSIEVKCYFRSTGWATEHPHIAAEDARKDQAQALLAGDDGAFEAAKARHAYVRSPGSTRREFGVGSFGDGPGTPRSPRSPGRGGDDDEYQAYRVMPARSTSFSRDGHVSRSDGNERIAMFPTMNAAQERPLMALLRDLGLESQAYNLKALGLVAVGDVRFVTDAELEGAGVPSAKLKAVRSHRLLVAPTEGNRGVPDKLSSATPEELKRLWTAFNELDVHSAGKLGHDEISAAIERVTGREPSKEEVAQLIARLVTKHGSSSPRSSSQGPSMRAVVLQAASLSGKRVGNLTPAQAYQRSSTAAGGGAPAPAGTGANGDGGGGRGWAFLRSQVTGGSAVKKLQEKGLADGPGVGFNDFARALLRNRGVLKMDKKGLFVNGAASLVALMQQTQRRQLHALPADSSANGRRRPGSVIAASSRSSPGSGVVDLLAATSTAVSSPPGQRRGHGSPDSQPPGSPPPFPPHSPRSPEGVDPEQALWKLEQLRARRLKCLMAGDVDVAANVTEQMKQAAVEAGFESLDHANESAGSSGSLALVPHHHSLTEYGPESEFEYDEANRKSSSVDDPTALQLFQCGAEAFDTFSDSLRLLASRVDPLLSATHKADMWLQALELHFDRTSTGSSSGTSSGGAAAPAAAKSWTSGLGVVLEGANKEGLDFIDELFDELDVGGSEELVPGHVCEGLLEILKINDVMTKSELEEVLIEFLDDYELTSGGNDSTKSAAPTASAAGGGGGAPGKETPASGGGGRVVGRVAFHAFLRWVLHYLFMLSVTDLCDDHRFIFSNLDQVVKFSRGRGGAEFLSKRFNVTAEDLLASEEKKAAEKERNELKKEIAELKQQRALEAQAALKEKERLAKVAQSLVANNAKNSMLEQELERVRDVLSSAISKRMELEAQLKAVRKKGGADNGGDSTTDRVKGEGVGRGSAPPSSPLPPPPRRRRPQPPAPSPRAGEAGVQERSKAVAAPNSSAESPAPEPSSFISSVGASAVGSGLGDLLGTNLTDSLGGVSKMGSPFW